MSRQLDKVTEDRVARKHLALIRAFEFELDGSVASQGGVFLGFSMKFEEWECLMTIRAVMDDEPSIAFVGSDSMINCILKAVWEAQRGKLKWREDRYAK